MSETRDIVERLEHEWCEGVVFSGVTASMLDLYHEAATLITRFRTENATLRSDCERLGKMQSDRDRSDWAAKQKWKKETGGIDFPTSFDLCTWLMQQLTQCRAMTAKTVTENATLKAECGAWRKFHGWSVTCTPGHSPEVDSTMLRLLDERMAAVENTNKLCPEWAKENP